MVEVKRDLSGLIFGRLTVIKQIEDKIYKNGRKVAQWECKCACDGKIINITGEQLKRGKTQSCGCLQKERQYEVVKKYNEYIKHKECYEGIIKCKNETYKFYIDLNDYDKIKNYSWCLNAGGYIMTVDDEKCIYIARLIMNCNDPNEIVDHIDHNILNNRKYNLRIVTKGENNINQNIAKNNTSGYSDVSWHKQSEKWMARISINNERIYLGLFDTLEDAAYARKQAEFQYYGVYRNEYKDWKNI